MKMLRILFLVLLISPVFGQESFTIQIAPAAINDLPPLHSYAHAQWDGKWLILGGHMSEDWDWSHQNLELIVVDPEQNKVWMADVSNLDHYIEEVEQITSCFAQFYQVGEKFYLLGGYGYSTHAEAYITFPYLTEINVKEVIQAIISNEHQEIGKYFRQVYEADFGVMEGYLTSIDNKFFLIGGVKFSGYYEGDEYQFQAIPSNKTVEFVIQEDIKDDLTILKLGSFDYSENFDELLPTYVPQIYPDNTAGVSIFKNEKPSDKDIFSWMNVFDIGYSVISITNQELPHYHSTVIPVYDEEDKSMHSIFLGGCNDFYCDVEDVYGELRGIDSIGHFQRDEQGYVNMEKHPITPFFSKGRDVQFLLNSSVPQFENGVIKLNELSKNKTKIGYLFGGATSVNPLIFRDGEILSKASNQVFEVYLIKKEKTIGDLKVDFSGEKNGSILITVPSGN